MVSFCCVPECGAQQWRGCGISFHSFPKDKNLFNKWVNVINKKDFKPTSSSKVCSKHFTKSDFRVNFGSIKLVAGAVPSIIDLKNPKQYETDPLSDDGAQTIAGNCSDSNLNAPPDISIPLAFTGDASTSLRFEEVNVNVQFNDQFLDEFSPKRFRSQPVYFGDFTERDLSDPIKVYKLWRIAHDQIARQRKTIETLRGRNRCLEKKVNKLQSVIEKLENDKKKKDKIGVYSSKKSEA